jgi:hypothetical protein
VYLAKMLHGEKDVVVCVGGGWCVWKVQRLCSMPGKDKSCCSTVALGSYTSRRPKRRNRPKTTNLSVQDEIFFSWTVKDLNIACTAVARSINRLAAGTGRRLQHTKYR